MTCRFSIPAFKYIKLIRYHKLFNFDIHSTFDSTRKQVIMQSFLDGELEEATTTNNTAIACSLEGRAKQIKIAKDNEYEVDFTSYSQSYTSYSLCK